jgi:hypothetical protein
VENCCRASYFLLSFPYGKMVRELKMMPRENLIYAICCMLLAITKIMLFLHEKVFWQCYTALRKCGLKLHVVRRKVI